MNGIRYYIITTIALFFAFHFLSTDLMAQNNYSAEFEIVSPNGNVIQSQNISAGDSLTFQGLPFPLQVLNNAKLHIPEGSLAENIELEVKLPDFSEISQGEQDVSFGQEIASAIEINVYVNGELVSPFHFEKPVILDLPIPDRLPDGIGSDVSSFALVYVEQDGSFEKDGIQTTFSDTVKGIVSAEVSHFSTIGMTSDSDENSYAADISINLPEGETSQSHRVTAGDTLTFQGLPFPLQVLNNAKLYIPEGSLAEDIELEVKLPDFSEISQGEQDVSFGQEIASAIEINVYVNGELVSPFHFEKPVILDLPIPDHLPDGIGSDVSSFALVYVEQDGSFEKGGIQTTFSDTVKGIVSAEVSHFSTIAMVESDQEATTITEDRDGIPAEIEVHQNYPNPFNPTTTIGFTVREAGQIQLQIFDMLGREVALLINGHVESGQHSVNFDASNLSSGVYLYRIESGNKAVTRQMTLIK